MSNTFCKLYLEQAFIDPNPTSTLTVAQVYITGLINNHIEQVLWRWQRRCLDLGFFSE